MTKKEYPAKFIKVLPNKNPLDRHSWAHTDLLYEYKGHEYIVTKHNNGYAFDSLWKQHNEAQKAIDEKIERANRPMPTEDVYKGSGQEGFDIFWEYVNE